MKFIFWQNVISIHQSAFIKALAMEHDVTLVAENTLDQQRIKEKWIVPDMGKAKVIVAPDSSQVLSLLQSQNTQHIFSGIDAYPMVYQAFQKAVKLNVPISVMAEPYEWDGFKGLLRRLKYITLYFRYGKNINHLFTTGHMGIKCYHKAGFPMNKLHQWGYFTEQDNTVLESGMQGDQSNCNIYKKYDDKKTKVKLLYVGRLDSNKNILPLLKRLNEYGSDIEYFTIIGDGPLFEEVVTLSKINTQIKVIGRLNNVEATKQMALHDYLILPSLYDGWGAVINEALTQGTRVLCSKSCGASILLDGKERGEAFSQNETINVIRKWCYKGNLIETERKRIQCWAKMHISGDVAAGYFTKLLKGEHVTAPWIN